MDKTVVELFAGVGGFRVGLNDVKMNKNGKVSEKSNFDFVFSNQWEPSTKVQHAFDCYQTRFGESDKHSNVDISLVDKKNEIPAHTLLVGGFPCQDYSVARTLSKEKGIQGIKGVLWWQIRDVLEAKRPPFVLLENVDRLLKSPSKQRGRDFGIMLRSMSDLGYGVEWRVINAADYGHPQRRRRVFIFGFHKTTNYYKSLNHKDYYNNITIEGLIAKAFPVKNDLSKNKQTNISKNSYDDLVVMTNNFKFGFENSGIMIDNEVFTAKVEPIQEKQIFLKEIVEKGDIEEKYFLDGSDKKFMSLKGSKKIARVNKETGIEYNYSEGKMVYPDPLDRPGRTMLTSEASVNRSTHVIFDVKTNRKRLITPVEAERLNEFPDNWTNTGMPFRRRYFMMGNALVTGVVRKFGQEILKVIDKEK
ncbi:MAG: DNA (cytosine-5-)-methyltransferase [Candidatus Izemoplasmataceae bacterium]